MASAVRPSDTEALDAYSRVVTGVADRLAPSVANLRVTRRTRAGAMPSGGGSAVVLTPDGFLLSNAHVVAGRGAGGRAAFVDGRELRFEVVGRDPLSDLALLRADARDLTPATLGDAEALRVGQLVVAIGNPHGFAGSVTAGVVSALGRSLPARLGRRQREFPDPPSTRRRTPRATPSRQRFSFGTTIDNVIQTDAALNPGNSGGALVNGDGEVVGINTAVAGVGLGLAVPINAATRAIVGQLMSDGRVRRAYLGIAGGPRPLPPRARADHGGMGSAVEVVEVVAGSPAERGGLRAEDLIVSIDGVATPRVDDVQGLMVADRIGRTVDVVVVRDGRGVQLRVTPTEMTAS